MNSKIIIETKATYNREHSQQQDLRFVYIYQIKIINNHSKTIQLLSRHWKITDANGEIQEVEGEGVVGEQPAILPNNFYQYESFCILPTPLGWMEGYYRFCHEDGSVFDVVIPRFKLEVPGIVQ